MMCRVVELVRFGGRAIALDFPTEWQNRKAILGNGWLIKLELFPSPAPSP
ncbi:hypothetical protein K9N68_34425 (plasmid) [Kovacikia minuta CCNUW1]|nr:hypothetical protein [Kovacikia minuta]UBF30311.1 hypothetical protein K9N68_34425 [Kovacikia minuta CCNUW1]